MIWVKITATEQELETYAYKPLVSGDIYQAEESKGCSGGSYYDIFYEEEYVMRGVWRGRLKVLTQDECREEKLNKIGIKEYQPHCYICYTMNVDTDMICDTCDEIYCDDCSYTFSLHYQHQGSRCYNCADQSRRTSLNKRDITLNKVLLKVI
jgi:hypothetical protein